MLIETTCSLARLVAIIRNNPYIDCLTNLVAITRNNPYIDCLTNFHVRFDIECVKILNSE